MSNDLGSGSLGVRVHPWRHRLLVLMVAFLSQGSFAAAAADYDQAIRELSAAAEAEVREGRISGASIALIDNQQIVFARGRDDDVGDG